MGRGLGIAMPRYKATSPETDKKVMEYFRGAENNRVSDISRKFDLKVHVVQRILNENLNEKQRKTDIVDDRV